MSDDITKLAREVLEKYNGYEAGDYYLAAMRLAPITLELLDALETIMESFVHDGSERIKTDIFTKCPDVRKAFNAARTVVSKAKGM